MHRRMISHLMITPQKIHMCKNKCVLFRGALKDCTTCPKCNTPRYRAHRVGHRRKPWKIYSYFPVIPRLRRLYNTQRTATLLQLHGRVDPSTQMRDLRDGDLWRKLYGTDGVFAGEPRHLSLGNFSSVVWCCYLHATHASAERSLSIIQIIIFTKKSAT